MRENLENLILRSRIISGYEFFNEFREIKEVKEIGADANDIFLKLLNFITFSILALLSLLFHFFVIPPSQGRGMESLTANYFGRDASHFLAPAPKCGMTL